MRFKNQIIREAPVEPTREELIALVQAQAAEIAALKARIAELERRLGLNSSNNSKLLPEDRLVELIADLFGVKLAAGAIAATSRACAGRLHDFVETLRDLLAGAPVKHLDETGFRVGGKTQWLNVASTALLTFYRNCARRGEMLADVVGVIVHDHWKPYYTMQGVRHALCNAHHLRELKALVEIRKRNGRAKCNGCCAPPSAPFSPQARNKTGASAKRQPAQPPNWSIRSANRKPVNEPGQKQKGIIGAKLG